MNASLKSVATAFVAAAAAVPVLLLSGAGTAQASPGGNPEVWFNPWPGGITVHFRSQAPTGANCTYNADAPGVLFSSYRRNFFLPAWSTHEEVFTPSAPTFRPWNIQVNCDNGKSTAFTYWY